MTTKKEKVSSSSHHYEFPHSDDCGNTMNRFRKVDHTFILKWLVLSREITVDIEGSGITSTADQFTWDEKYFLIRIWFLFGPDVLIVKPYNDLMPALEMRSERIKALLERFENLGLVSREKDSGKRGRPITGFTLHSEPLEKCFCKEDLKYRDFELKHFSLIENLLCWGERGDDVCLDLGEGEDQRSERAYIKDENHKDLDGKSRMFLSVLLAHADKFGFVEDLSQTEIERMTSLSEGQQRGLTKKLLKSGYIRSDISGITNSVIFGRVKSTYCLNTCIAKLTDWEPISITLIKGLTLRAARYNEAEQFLHCVDRSIESEDTEEAIKIRSIFAEDLSGIWVKSKSLFALKGKVEKSISWFLQFRLETYACWFLSEKGFSSCVKENRLPEFESVRLKIHKEVVVVSKNTENMEAAKTIADIFYEIARRMAVNYCLLLNDCDPKSLSNNVREYRVFPREKNYSDVNVKLSLGIASRFKHFSREEEVAFKSIRRDPNDGNITHGKQNTQKYIVEEHISEDQVSIDLRVECGLLSEIA